MKKLTGQIIKDKMDKTRIVAVTDKRHHAIYNKTFTVTTKISAHDAENEYKNGDVVEIIPTKPISKNKSWLITKKVK